MNPIQGMLAATRRGLGSLKVVMATGLYKTAAGVVSARVVKENAEALRGYLTVHLRSAKAAQHALAGIEDAVEHGTAEMLTRGPSKRAALFLAAKNAVEYERLFGESAAAPASAAPWEPTPPGRPEGWGRALDEVRFGLGPEESELIELAHARSLNADEIAYVLSAPKEDVSRKLDAARAYAKLLLEDVFGDEAAKHLEKVFEDAFAVLPPTPEDIAATKVKVVPLPAGTIVGDRYEIESRIGGGEFAYVYRARDVRVPGHVVALKLLHRVARTAAAREGAIRELSLIASAFHPSLVQFKDHGWFEDRLWFVMPFYDGEELLERLERGPLPLDEALAHFERLARGLAALHAAGIRHQDVKPENIFLVRLSTGADVDRPEVFPVLLDLGVAAPNGEMALAGTPMYFAPEVAARIFDEECEIPLTAKADVFALALSLLHSIEEPDLTELDGVEVDAFLKKRAEASPSGPRSRELRRLKSSFARWLAPHPNDRPSAGQLADEIAALRGTGRRTVSAPAGLGPALVGFALTALVIGSAALVDVPARRVEVVESDGAAVHPTRELNETERVRVLRHRLEVERQRGRELEDELARLRQRDLGIEAAPEPADAAESDDEAPTAREERPARRHRG